MVYLAKREIYLISGMDLRGPNAKEVYDTFHDITQNETGGNKNQCFQKIVLEAKKKRTKKNDKEKGRT